MRCVQWEKNHLRRVTYCDCSFVSPSSAVCSFWQFTKSEKHINFKRHCETFRGGEGAFDDPVPGDVIKRAPPGGGTVLHPLRDRHPYPELGSFSENYVKHAPGGNFFQPSPLNSGTLLGPSPHPFPLDD